MALAYGAASLVTFFPRSRGSGKAFRRISSRQLAVVRQSQRRLSLAQTLALVGALIILASAMALAVLDLTAWGAAIVVAFYAVLSFSFWYTELALPGRDTLELLRDHQGRPFSD